MKATVLAPAASAKPGTVTLPPDGAISTGAAPLTEAVVFQPVPVGAVSATAQLAPWTAPVRVGVAEPPLPSAAVVKLDGQVPL